MRKITVLGAGYMGSAITYPLADNDFEVSLWGTWLDDSIITVCQKGKDHPKLKLPINKKVRLFNSSGLGHALKDSDIVFFGITSEGFTDVISRSLEYLKKDILVFALTKGFTELEGKVMTVSTAGKTILGRRFKKEEFSWCSIGGPVKALELARKIPSVSSYATKSKTISGILKHFETDYYRIDKTPDITGLEVSSALKNIYATGIGICDGIYLPGSKDMYHNMSSWMYSQSIIEISEIAGLAGGLKGTIYGFGGIGDLFVTSMSGRNRRLGELIGKGIRAEKAYNKMLSEGEVGEGYNALKLVFKWLKDIMPEEYDAAKRLPLLVSLYDIFFNLKDAENSLGKVFKHIGKK